MTSAVAPFSQNAWMEMRGIGRARIAAGIDDAVAELASGSADADELLGGS